uniref:DUF1653 domain-containing protein n=1 Tax=Corethron hystrix TaxID=216773 RepID=A0A7S1FK25_9STRA|mmetsp:Transcript_104/g.228  ORF Transcript_104/g.228 Transcript_104/m.228 type:complete len:145 (+) Transcript_104:51-485(+)
MSGIFRMLGLQYPVQIDKPRDNVKNCPNTDEKPGSDNNAIVSNKESKETTGKPDTNSSSVSTLTTIQIGLYRHYKGKQYHVIGLCRHSETHEVMVLYQALYGEHKLWVRPIAMFTEFVQMEDGTHARRFMFVGPMWGEAANLNR